MSLIIKQKKGALQLSINAIVVLILAITMLGLGLGFMKSMFEKTTGQFDDISDSMKNQIIEDVKNSNDKVILNKYDIEIKKGTSKYVYYGIKNVDSGERTFNTTMQCSGGISESSTGTDIEFEYSDDHVVLEESNVKVLKMNIVPVANAKVTSYDCYIQVNYISGFDPLGAAWTVPTNPKYQRKDFYVTIV